MSLSLRAIWTGLIVLLAFPLAFFLPRLGNAALSAIEHFGSRLARRKRLAVLSVAVAAIVVRLSLLWWIPVPVPETHDEFSYLLAGDTFAHGRLTNPPHPMWIYFETFHVIQQPRYMSKYPPAQGLALAAGEILGHPWIGVLLSAAGMCAAVTWALQGWLPAQWALLGGTLALLRLSLWGYWVNSYWGGAVAALGGALVVGALPRIMRSRRRRDAVVLGIGLALLANSRPLEGLIFWVPLAIVLLLWLLRGGERDWNDRWGRVVVPVCAVAGLCFVLDGYYNWRGTGNALVMPYSVYERTYWNLPAFAWQEPRPPVQYSNPQLARFYQPGGWAYSAWAEGQVHNARQFVSRLASNVKFFVSFFLWPELCVPVVLTAWRIQRDRKLRLLLIQMAVCLTATLLVAWFQPHYAGALTATAFILVIQGMRHLRLWRYRGRPVGVALTRVVVILAVALAPFHQQFSGLVPSLAGRARMARQLKAMPGEHLVIVRYSAEHDPQEEWVYNAADVDHAKVVWAREIPGLSLEPLLEYFHNRRVWVIEPDADTDTVELFPYSTARQTSSEHP